jgi:hypothetical protein
MINISDDMVRQYSNAIAYGCGSELLPGTWDNDNLGDITGSKLEITVYFCLLGKAYVESFLTISTNASSLAMGGAANSGVTGLDMSTTESFPTTDELSYPSRMLSEG